MNQDRYSYPEHFDAQDVGEQTQPTPAPSIAPNDPAEDARPSTAPQPLPQQAPESEEGSVRAAEQGGHR